MLSSMFTSALALTCISALTATLPAVSHAAPIAIRQTATYTGDGTFYETGLGACGINNVDTDFIAAVASATFDNFPGATANPNENPICNKQVTATYQGKSVTVSITDRCAGCAGAADLDFSPSAFSVLAPESVGRLEGLTWVFTD
jgi:hypothetical protein